MFLKSCTLTGNKAGFIGGGLFINSENFPNVRVEQCDISNNVAVYGGGLGTILDNDVAIGHETNFIGNVATTGGGVAV